MGILRSDKILDFTQDSSSTPSRFYIPITSQPLKDFNLEHYLLMQNQKSNNEKYVFIVRNPCSKGSKVSNEGSSSTSEESEDYVNMKHSKAHVSVVDVSIEEIYFPYSLPPPPQVLNNSNLTLAAGPTDSSKNSTPITTIQLPPLGVEKIVVDLGDSFPSSSFQRKLELSLQSQNLSPQEMIPRNVAVFFSLGREISNVNERIPQILSVNSNTPTTLTILPCNTMTPTSPPTPQIPPAPSPPSANPSMLSTFSSSSSSQETTNTPLKRDLPKATDKLYLWLQCVNGFTMGCPLSYRFMWRMNDPSKVIPPPSSPSPSSSSSISNSSQVISKPVLPPPNVPSLPLNSIPIGTSTNAYTKSDSNLSAIIGIVVGLLCLLLMGACGLVAFVMILVHCLLRKKRKERIHQRAHTLSSSSSTLFSELVPTMVLPPPIGTYFTISNAELTSTTTTNCTTHVVTNAYEPSAPSDDIMERNVPLDVLPSSMSFIANPNVTLQYSQIPSNGHLAEGSTCHSHGPHQ
ncbi:hypothetical protein FDP41_007261 [Naegleria fowleri]|uniref:Uncharacterized protein n=1 Tax=Naegleria fowleri TaxID=5763 RepID=A0A6A5BII4_NAEFO|nr:uncharacterized protein FDP41_007261 [Naegleria fowleri]KAF0973874.1 hypothetical protein FDP41_007261 [Naegleria fowleri]